MRWDRGGARPFAIGEPATPAIKALLVANIVVFVFQTIAQALVQVRIERLFGLVPYDVVHHLFVWQLATYMFLHGGFFHIAFNLLTLWVFGTWLESLWGAQKFLRYYFITGIGAGIMTTLVTPNSMSVTIGASGAIYGVLVAAGLLFPDRTVYLYFLVPVRVKYLVWFMVAVAFLSSLSSTGDGVAHVAHLGGIIFGWLYLRGPRRPWQGNPISGAYQRWRRNRLRKKFTVYYSKTRGEDEEDRG